MMKLNLGCGMNKIPGYVNVDIADKCNPDVILDLNITPWTFNTSSVSEIIMSHVFEHVGFDTETFFNIVKELYRILIPNGAMFIVVPHPRSDNFIGDPTHVRVITPQVMSLFSKRLNNEWVAQNAANSPLGIHLDVNFEIESVTMILNKKWKDRLESKSISMIKLQEATEMYNNVIDEIQMKIVAIK